MNKFLENVLNLPIDISQQTAAEVLALPAIALARGLTNYDATYLALAMRARLPLATSDEHLRKVAESAGISILRAT
jgi:predicted nucleic acid-binding protein